MHIVCQFNSFIVFAKLDISCSMQRWVSTLNLSVSQLTCLETKIKILRSPDEDLRARGDKTKITCGKAYVILIITKNDGVSHRHKGWGIAHIRMLFFSDDCFLRQWDGQSYERKLGGITLAQGDLMTHGATDEADLEATGEKNSGRPIYGGCAFGCRVLYKKRIRQILKKNCNAGNILQSSLADRLRMPAPMLRIG